ncbi:MAG: hypothetical protein ABL970_06645 [Nitrospira sp.]
MSYRYSSIDIIVGFGMCAIVFGALFLFVATTGTFLVATPPAMVDQFSQPGNGMVWLQPALGQAIVERTLLQRASDRVTAQATLEWDQALLAHYSLQSLPGGPFGQIMDRAAIIPDDHEARVQAVMGRTIVNGTRRGVRSGVLSADHYLSDYNRNMIGAAEQLGGRMHGAFAATWQPLLGRWIVDASRDYAARVVGVQEQLGMAIVHVAQARSGMEEAWGANQYQLGTLLAAVDRTATMAEPVDQIMVASVAPMGAVMASASVMAWPGIPLGYLFAAMIGMALVFFSGLRLSAMSREAKAHADLLRDRDRWVYRPAA